jgi:hypothetical protein
MADGRTSPVIVGLAVGIGFVAVFSVFLTSPLGRKGSNSAVTLGEEGQTIFIDFGVSLPERDIIIKKGETTSVPVTIETQGSIEKVLSLSIRSHETGTEAPDPGGLSLALDRESVVLSEENIAQGSARMGDNVTIGYGWMVTDAGYLTIAASPTATDGTFEYIVEANWEGKPGEDGMGSGQLFTVTVTD